MKNKIFISLATSFLLFGCGSGTSSVSKPSTEITANITDTILVVDNMKKDVLIRSDRENVWFEFADKTNVPSGTELSKYTGRLIFRALNGVGSIEKVSVRAADDSGWKSDNLTLVFKTVSSDSVIKKRYIRTGADDNGTGLERSFVQTDDGYVNDPFGNVWENNISGKSAEPNMYLLSKQRCEILHQMNKNSNWRVPTSDELLNLIDYGKEFGTNMLDDIFADINLTTWAKAEGENQLIFSPLSGLIFNAKIINKYPVRCINAPENKIDHVVSTDRFSDITYDFSTSLMWSPMSKDKYSIETNASQYCKEYNQNANGQWRLPSINEVRSIVENHFVSYNIIGQNTIIPSSTLVNNKDINARRTHYVLSVDGKTSKVAVSYSDNLYYITCVRTIEN
jgi:hypothetical protein